MLYAFQPLLCLKLCWHNRLKPKPWTLSYCFHYKSHLKQLYICKKIEHFSYKGECGVRVSQHLKEGLAFKLISNVMLMLRN